MPNIVPMIHDDRLSYDIFSKLLKDRVIWLMGKVNEVSSHLICTELLYLDSLGRELDDSDESDRAIHFYINSPGGSVSDGLAIFDTMNHIECPVYTYCVGEACSMGSFLLAAGKKGHRYTFPNSTIMIHQPLGGTGFDQASQVEKRAQHLLNTKKRLTEIMCNLTGKKYATVERDMDRDNFMNADEAVKYGIVDKILDKQTQKK